ncbi:hypothetical protein EMIHUDRAFT_458453 [Emiliania huxleyi CCMP1516]|uniref:Uncharacterized protein n=2 Tax=Emiliania huxleyi TaxID=2903 RepID=A0A0D3JCD5_EMIH1|nr:hypothetical protein EMIHUDRAFT_458453 [Emiliania huxleyi CCMP1516]EOD21170.1 hypothetical protein EMIHUDRAFT_458453 [Emiliania huxleyi CCMP1516]|eukprot:XP_005773599.1 hypothetical protein EMIHUDRAFT_458453 [Emiliania huxleyi CCMP1516]
MVFLKGSNSISRSRISILPCQYGDDQRPLPAQLVWFGYGMLTTRAMERGSAFKGVRRRACGLLTRRARARGSVVKGVGRQRRTALLSPIMPVASKARVPAAHNPREGARLGLRRRWEAAAEPAFTVTPFKCLRR